MPNGGNKREQGSNGRRSSDYNPQWCNERYNTIERQIADIWGDEKGGIKALWTKINGINRKLWAIMLGQVAILGGIIAALLDIGG